MTDYERRHWSGPNRLIAKPYDGLKPPDTYELEKLNEALNYIARRIWVLRTAVCRNNAIEDGRVRRLMAGRKRAIKKAYQKGRDEARKRHRA